MKPKQNINFIKSYTQLEKYGTCTQCEWFTGRQKEKRSGNIKNTFLFLKQLIQLKSLKCSFISPKKAIETCHCQMLIVQNFKANGTYYYCYKLKRK